MPKNVFYVKYSRRNGQVSVFKEAGSNVLKKFFNIAEAKEFAAMAISRLVRKRDTSPAAIDRVWVFSTHEA